MAASSGVEGSGKPRATQQSRTNEGRREGQQEFSKVIDPHEEREIEVVIADQDGAPIERYPVELARTAAYGCDEEVVWFEVSDRRMFGLVAPCDPKPKSALAD